LREAGLKSGVLNCAKARTLKRSHDHLPPRDNIRQTK
jgi:hypothetical protein